MSQVINSKNLRLNLKKVLELVEAGMKFNITYRSRTVAQLIPQSLSKNKGNSKEVVSFLSSFKVLKKKQTSKDANKNTKDLYLEAVSKKYKKYF